MNVPSLSPALQFFLSFCTSFIAFGSIASWSGVWSIQPFLIMPPCALAGNATRCCPTCLGIEHIEYGLYIAIPGVVAIAGVVGSGVFLDIFGLPTTAILLTLICVSGNVLRAVATHFVFHHSVMLFFFILGETILECAHFGLFVCREYIPNRYFDVSKRPLVFGIAVGISNGGNLLAGFVMPPLAAKLGIPSVLWIFTALSAIGIVVAIALCLVFRFSSEVRALDDEVRYQKQQQQRLSCSEAVANARSFQPQYWIIFVAFPLAIAIGMSFEANVSDYQTTFGAISPVQAGVHIAWGYIGYIFAAPAIGCVLWITGYRVLVIALLVLLMGVSVSLMFVAPLLSVILTFIMYSAIVSSTRVFYSFYVPIESLGLAGSLQYAANLTDLCLLSMTIGGIEQVNPGKKGARIALLIQSSVTVVSVCLLLFLRCYYGNPISDNECKGVSDFCRTDKEEEEKQQILQDKE